MAPRYKDVSDPAANAKAITPDDDVDLPNTTRAIFVGVGGDITVNMAGTGAAVEFLNVASGSILPVQVTRVLEATTATDMLALY